MKLTRDIHSLSTFKRDTAKLVRQLKKTGQPVVLTVNGKAELVVQDAESYQKLLEAKVEPTTIDPDRVSGASVENGIIYGGINNGESLFVAGE